MGKLDKRPDQRNLKAVKRTLDVLDEEVQALNRERVHKKRKREFPEDPADGSIPKPKGTAGKGGNKGYNLQSAMGLNDNHNTYLWLLERVRKAAPKRGIDTDLTITKNRPRMIFLFIIYCQKRWHFFRRFQDGWAVHDMLAGHLVNQRGAQNSKMRRLKAEGIDTKDIDSASEASGGEDSDDESMPLADNSKPEIQIVKKKVKVPDGAIKMSSKSGRPSKLKKMEESDIDMNSSDAESSDQESDTEKLQFSRNVPPSKARKSRKAPVVKSASDVADEDNELASAWKRSPSLGSNRGDEDGFGPIDANDSDELEYIDVITPPSNSTPAPKKPPGHKIETDLITLFDNIVSPPPKKATKSKPKAKAVKGFDLQNLADRVWALRPALDPLMNDAAAHMKIFFWTDEIFDGTKASRDIATRLNKGQVPEYLLDHLQVGRYGERGRAVIHDSLAAMYDLTPEFIPASQPLSLSVYTSTGWEQVERDNPRTHPLLDVDPALNAVIKSNAKLREARLVDKTKKKVSAKSYKENIALTDPPITKATRNKKKPTPGPSMNTNTRKTRTTALVLTENDYPAPSGKGNSWKVAAAAPADNLKKKKRE